MSSEQEALEEYAVVVGRDNPDQAWISTPYDVWRSNPFYRGTPVPYPEDAEETP
jgi:hypothetical protein